MAVLIAPLIGAIAPTLGSGTALAAGNGSYEFSNSSHTSISNNGYQIGFGIICHSSDSSKCPYGASDLATALNNSDLYFSYSSTSGSNYIFTLDPGGCTTITIAKSAPARGVLKPCGGNNTNITLGSSNLFTSWANNGGASSAPKVVTISGSINIDYGTIDNTKTLGPSDISGFVKCASGTSDFCKAQESLLNSDNSGLAGLLTAGTTVEPASAAPDIQTLTKNPVKYTAVFKSDLLKAGTKYVVCFKGAVIKDASGNTNATKCTGAITAKAGSTASGSTSAKGDIGKLTSDTKDDQNTNDDCEGSAGFFGWIVCGVIDAMQNAIGGIFDHIIQPLLVTQPLTTDGANEGTYKAWSNFRTYGDIFLVIALLVVVFGESLGGGVIDAYTAKKILPRLLITAVLMNISYYLVAVLVDIMNIIGNGIMALMVAPFNLAGGFTLSINGTGSVAMTGLLAGAIVWGGAASLSFLPWLWFTVIIPMLLVMIAILAVVLLRRALIVLLVIVSPVAFALYCLPNTEKYFRSWWDTLFKTLLVYPIISVLFTMGKIGAFLISQTGGSAVTGALAGIMSVITLVIPLALIPFAFKIAGGFLGRLHDTVSGVRERAHAMGQSSRDRAKQRAAYSRASNFAKAENRVLNPLRNQRGPIGWAAGRRVEGNDQKIRRLGAALGKDENAAAIQHDDDALRAATYDSYLSAVSGVRRFKEQQAFKKIDADFSAGKIDENEANTRRAAASASAQTEAIRAARAAQGAVGFGRAQGTWAAQKMVETGTAIDNIDDMSDIIARVGKGNASTIASLSGNMNAATKSAGRHDLAGSFDTVNRIASAKARGDKTVEIGGKQVDIKDALSVAQTNAWNSASLYQHANDKGANIAAAIDHYEGELTSGDATKVEQAAVFFNELRSMQPNASGDVKNKIQDALSRNEPTLSAAVSSLPDTPASPETIKRVVEERQVLDPASGDYVVQRSQTGTRQESARERIERLSRTYERPDPNNIT